MALRACMLAAGLALAAGLNLVNRKSKMCLDLHAPCIDGSEDKSCQRMPVDALKAGTNLQLFACNGKSNQEFEMMANGRMRNPYTDLCLDIMAPCKDHFRNPCERESVSELKKQANIQLYTCHTDTGVLSNSYGNQLWNFEAGQLRNPISNLCLQPKLDTDGKMMNMSNIWAETCEEAVYQKFDFLEHDPKLNTEPSMQTHTVYNIAPAPAAHAPGPAPPLPAESVAPDALEPAAPAAPLMPVAPVVPVAPVAPVMPLAVQPPQPAAPPLPAAQPLVATPPLPVAPPPMVALAPPPMGAMEAKFQQVPSNVGLLEADARGQPQVFIFAAFIALTAGAAWTASRRAGTREHVALRPFPEE